MPMTIDLRLQQDDFGWPPISEASAALQIPSCAKVGINESRAGSAFRKTGTQEAAQEQGKAREA